MQNYIQFIWPSQSKPNPFSRVLMPRSQSRRHWILVSATTAPLRPSTSCSRGRLSLSSPSSCDHRHTRQLSTMDYSRRWELPSSCSWVRHILCRIRTLFLIHQKFVLVGSGLHSSDHFACVAVVCSGQCLLVQGQLGHQ